jgi:hypothetical protein
MTLLNRDSQSIEGDRALRVQQAAEGGGRFGNRPHSQLDLGSANDTALNLRVQQAAEGGGRFGNRPHSQLNLGSANDTALNLL